MRRGVLSDAYIMQHCIEYRPIPMGLTSNVLPVPAKGKMFGDKPLKYSQMPNRPKTFNTMKTAISRINPSVGMKLSEDYVRDISHLRSDRLNENAMMQRFENIVRIRGHLANNQIMANNTNISPNGSGSSDEVNLVSPFLPYVPYQHVPFQHVPFSATPLGSRPPTPSGSVDTDSVDTGSVGSIDSDEYRTDEEDVHQQIAGPVAVREGGYAIRDEDDGRIEMV